MSAVTHEGTEKRSNALYEGVITSTVEIAQVGHLEGIGDCDRYLQKKEKKDYLDCLKSSSHQSETCRRFSKKYLECRMAKNLMARQDMLELGFGKEVEAEAEAPGANESKRTDK